MAVLDEHLLTGTGAVETSREHWRRCDFGTDRFGGCYFTVWELTVAGVTVAGASPEQARNRMAAKLMSP